MKIIIVLAVLVSCSWAQEDVRQELLDKATNLEARVKAEIQKLVDEKRDHLTQVLKEEETRLEALVAQLKNTTDPLQLSTIEGQLIDSETRIETEVTALSRDTLTQDLLLQDANNIKKWVAQEVKAINDMPNGPNKQRAEQVLRVLEQEDNQLNQLITVLEKAQDQRQIETLEVQLRALEVRIEAALKSLGFKPTTDIPTTHTPAPTTPTATPSTPTPTTPPTTVSPSTPPTTVSPSTPPTTVSPSTPPTTVPPTTNSAGPTRSATEIKDELVKRATDLETKVKDEINQLVNEKREHLAALLRDEETRLEKLVNDLKAATDPIQLVMLEAELIQAEFRVDNEVNLLQRDSATQELLVEVANGLKTRLTAEIQKLDDVLLGSPEKARAEEAARMLRREEATLDVLVNQLTHAQTQREIETVEAELRALETRIYQTLKNVGGF